MTWLTVDDFADRVGERFLLAADVAGDAGDGPTLELVEVSSSGEAGGRGPAGEERMQFALVFRGPAAPVLPQGIRHLRHDDLGELELFLVPLGVDAGGARYEAAFA